MDVRDDDATGLSPPSASDSLIPGLELTRELGRGGMAVVYEGRDLGFNPPRHVAVKLMSTEISADDEFDWTRRSRQATANP